MIALQMICVAVSLLVFGGVFSYMKDVSYWWDEGRPVDEKILRIIVMISGILIALAPVSWFMF